MGQCQLRWQSYCWFCRTQTIGEQKRNNFQVKEISFSQENMNGQEILYIISTQVLRDMTKSSDLTNDYRLFLFKNKISKKVHAKLYTFVFISLSGHGCSYDWNKLDERCTWKISSMDVQWVVLWFLQRRYCNRSKNQPGLFKKKQVF